MNAADKQRIEEIKKILALNSYSAGWGKDVSWLLQKLDEQTAEIERIKADILHYKERLSFEHNDWLHAEKQIEGLKKQADSYKEALEYISTRKWTAETKHPEKWINDFCEVAEKALENHRSDSHGK